jgi:hypothetical protein
MFVMLRFIVSVVLSLLSLSSFALVKGLRLDMVVNPLYLVLSILVVMAMLIATDGVRALWKGVRFVMRKDGALEQADYAAADCALRLVSRTLLLTGSCFTFFCMLTINDPADVYLVWRALASAGVALGENIVVILILLLPLHTALKIKYAGQGHCTKQEIATEAEGAVRQQESPRPV